MQKVVKRKSKRKIHPYSKGKRKTVKSVLNNKRIR